MCAGCRRVSGNGVRQQLALRLTFTHTLNYLLSIMTNINCMSNKDEIISAAVELTDQQAVTIKTLEAQQRILFVALSVVTVFAWFS